MEFIQKNTVGEPSSSPNPIWKVILVASFVPLATVLMMHPPKSDSFQVFFLTALSVCSFVLLIIRFLIGGTNYNLICTKFGLNDIPHSKFILSKHKTFLDSLFLAFQSLLMIFLAYQVRNPLLYIYLLTLLFFINIVWLSVQSICLYRHLRCVVKKSNHNSQLFHKEYLTSKIDVGSLIARNLFIWLLNNFAFIVMTLMILYGQFMGSLKLEAILILSIINSIVDLKLTFSIYSRPTYILKDRKFYNPSEVNTLLA